MQVAHKSAADGHVQQKQIPHRSVSRNKEAAQRKADGHIQHVQAANRSAAAGHVQQKQKPRRSVSHNKEATQCDQLDTVNSNFVSFYFTNVPNDISYISLR